MELDLGKLKITIGVDNQEAKEKLNETADSVSGVGSKIGSALGGIGKRNSHRRSRSSRRNSSNS